MNNITLYPGVELYRGLLHDLDSMIDLIENFHSNGENRYALKDWESWYTFGSQRFVNDNYPNGPFEENDLTKQLVDSIENAFYQATGHFIEKYKIDSSKFHHQGFALCKYQEHFDTPNGLVMLYHTDFQQLKRDQPGTKHLITSTMYLNDDYDGGEISYYIDDDLFHYKPQKGDILVWPSIPPFYHGVKKVEKSPKYFVRTFWYEDRPATTDWNIGKTIFGDEKWEKMELNREKSNTYQFIKTPNEKAINLTDKIQGEINGR